MVSSNNTNNNPAEVFENIENSVDFEDWVNWQPNTNSEISSLDMSDKHKLTDKIDPNLIADSGLSVELDANLPPSRSPKLVHNPNWPQGIEPKQRTIQVAGQSASPSLPRRQDPLREV
jgi:hypothetical protein